MRVCQKMSSSLLGPSTAFCAMPRLYALATLGTYDAVEIVLTAACGEQCGGVSLVERWAIQARAQLSCDPSMWRSGYLHVFGP